MTFIEIAGWLATVTALGGAWLNNRRRRACFLMWLVSNTLTFGIHAVAGLWPLAARDGAFFLLALHGWRLWSAQPRNPKVTCETQSPDRRG